MRIFLDTRDHIWLIDRCEENDTNAFAKSLQQGCHELVYSMHNIMEYCAPLLQSSNNNSIMRGLNRLEDIPHAYIAEVKIPMLELMEGTRAFQEQREYIPIDPFVQRFYEVVSPFDQSARHKYMRYGLAEAVFEIWRDNPALLQPYTDVANQVLITRNLDRNRPDYKQHIRKLPNSILKNLKLYNIDFPRDKVNDLATWILNNPNRCPATKLSYEVYHKIVRNLNDQGEVSDIPDFTHVDCIPYVDAITLDRRMLGYVKQADCSMGTQYSEKLFSNLNGIRTSIDKVAD